MADLLDVGNGVKLVDFTKGGATAVDPLERAQKAMSLVDLANRIEQAPLDNKIKQIDAALKGNQLLMTDIANETQRVELTTKKNAETRSNTQFWTNQVQELPKIFALNPELGKNLAAKLGIAATENKDGTVTMFAPGANGATKPFTLDPRNVADPEKRRGMEKELRGEWEQSTKSFRVQDNFYKNIQSLAPLKTAQSDLGIIFSYMKLLDPMSSVRDGERASAENAPGVPDKIRTQYNALMQQMEGNPNQPLFSDKARQGFIDAAGKIHGDVFAQTKQSAEFLLGVAERSYLDGQNIINPVGGISYGSLRGKKEQTPQSPMPGQGGQRSAPTGGTGAAPPVSSAPQGAGEAPPTAATPPPEKKKFNLQETTSTFLQNLQKKGP